MFTVNTENSFLKELISKKLASIISAINDEGEDDYLKSLEGRSNESKRNTLVNIINLVEDESLSIDYLEEFFERYKNNFIITDSENISNIAKMRETGRLPTKSLSLYQQFNIHVYTEYYKRIKELDSYLAYKSIENITEEVKRLYTVVFGSAPVNLDPYEFLNINDRLPDMITGKKIIFYSFILNYDSSIIDDELMEVILDLADMTPSSLGFIFDGSHETENKALWNSLGSKYYKFFTYLEENTL